MAFSGRGNKICDRVQALNTIRKSKSGKLALAMSEAAQSPVVVKGQTEPQRLVWPTSLRKARQPLRYFDLLTRRTVGLLELYSLLPDADHFLHCEQTLRLHSNTIG